MTRISRDEQTLYKLLSLIEDGHLVVVNPQGREFSFGQPGEWPTLRVLIRNPKTYKRILSATSLGIGESYMEGWWDEENDNLLDLAGLIFTNNIYSKLLGDFSLVLRLLVQRFPLHLFSLKIARKMSSIIMVLAMIFIVHFWTRAYPTPVDISWAIMTPLMICRDKNMS
jgi:cyclopropane-fatty-acyl-phospholipid synthase